MRVGFVLRSAEIKPEKKKKSPVVNKMAVDAAFKLAKRSSGAFYRAAEGGRAAAQDPATQFRLAFISMGANGCEMRSTPHAAPTSRLIPGNRNDRK